MRDFGQDKVVDFWGKTKRKRKMNATCNFLKQLKEREKWSKIWYISVFDHWLTHEEADNCQVLCYSIAKKNQQIDNYLQGENHFLNFYSNLSDEVVSFHNPNGICHLMTQSPRFQQTLIRSLREIRMNCWFYPKIGILIVGGFDRTDMLILSERTNKELLEKILKTNQLYILSQYTNTDKQFKETIDDVFDY